MPPLAFCASLLLALAPAGPTRTYLQERAAAVARGATAADLADADRLAARARGAPPRLAARLTRDARWALPAEARDLGPHVARVLGGERLRHAGRVNALAYAAPDRLVSSSADGTARLWNVGNGRQLLSYDGHPKDGAAVTDVLIVGSAAVGPKSLAASAGNGEIHIWNRDTGARLRTIPAAAGATLGLAFSPDGRFLYGAGDDGVLATYAVATGEPAGQRPPPLGSRAESLVLDPAGKFAALGTTRGGLVVYPLQGGLPGVPGASAVVAGPVAVSAAAVVPGTTNILTGARDGSVKLSGVTPGGVGSVAVLKTYPVHPGRVQALAALPDGKRFATGSADGAVRIWDIATGAIQSLYPVAEPAIGESDGGVLALAASPDGSELAAGTFDGAIKLLPLASDDPGTKAADATAPLWAVAATGGRVAAAGEDGAIRLYDAASGELERTLSPRLGAVSALAFAGPDALLAGGANRRLDRIGMNGELTPSARHAGTVLAVAFDPARKIAYSGGIGGELVATGPGDAEARVKLPAAVCAIRPLDSGAVAVGLADGSIALVERGEVVGRASAHTAGTAALAAGPAGVLYSVGGDGSLGSWQVAPGGSIRPGRRADPAPPAAGAAPRALALAAVAVSPDGKSVATGGADGVARVYSAIDLSETRAFRGHDGWVTGVAFTPDGRALFTAGADKTVRRFELPRPVAAGHAGPVTAVASSPDGVLIATGSADRSAKVWDRASGKLLATIPGASGVAGVGFGPAGELIVGAQDGSVRWWDWRAPRELRKAILPGEGRTLFLLAADPESGNVAAAWTGEDGAAGASRFNADGAPAGEVPGTGLNAAALSGDAKRVAFAGDDGVRVAEFGAAAPTPWSLFEGGTVDLGLSRDGATLVGVGDKKGTAVDGTALASAAKVADVAAKKSGAAIAIPRAIGLAVAPSGERFLTWDALGGVALYGRGGRELRRWALPSAARVAVVSGDGKVAVTGHRDGTATVLDLGE